MKAGFEELLKKLQGLVKDRKDNVASEVESIVEQLRTFAGSEAQRAYLVNISDQKYMVSRSYGNIWIEPRKEDGEPSVTAVDSVVDHMDFGLGFEKNWDPATSRLTFRTRTIPVPFSAERIAEDVANEVNGCLGQGAFVGVFPSLTPSPSRTALEEAKQRFVAYQQNLVFHADQKWMKKPDFAMISDAERRAANYLGIEKDWCYSPEEMTECPACHSRIRPNSFRCSSPSCGAILNVEKCIEFGIPVPEYLLNQFLEKKTKPDKRA